MELFSLEIIEKGEPEVAVSVQMVPLKDRAHEKHSILL